VIAFTGRGLGQVVGPESLAVDAAGNLYFGDGSNGGQIRQRDARGNWSVIATAGTGLGQVVSPSGLAVDAAGNLYVADAGNNRVQKYMPSP
jgi:DNA-binding beta-propeller fold protein YncE